MAVTKAKKIKSVNIALTLREMRPNSIVVFYDVEASNQTVRTTILRLHKEDGDNLYTSKRIEEGTSVLRIK